VFRRLSKQNHLLAVASRAPGFSRRKIPRSNAYTISVKAIRFQHPDYDPERAQKLISSSMSRQLSTLNISSKSMHAFLRNLATDRQTDRQADKQTRAKTCNMYTSSFVGGKLEVVVVDTALHDQIKAIGNSRSGIPGNFTKKIWFVKHFCAKWWQNRPTGKIRLICFCNLYHKSPRRLLFSSANTTGTAGRDRPMPYLLYTVILTLHRKPSMLYVMLMFDFWRGILIWQFSLPVCRYRSGIGFARRNFCTITTRWYDSRAHILC